MRREGRDIQLETAVEAHLSKTRVLVILEYKRKSDRGDSSLGLQFFTAIAIKEIELLYFGLSNGETQHRIPGVQSEVCRQTSRTQRTRTQNQSN